ncbi:MAG: hypothetical protein FJ276_09495, partial [Planctomycetes bacterium]|nr:hypothetical protein [Planctomycetota bacterium]
MPATRRIIRKTEPARRPRVDDQFWPVAVAMVVLGGFLAGTVLAYLRLDDPRWYANAVTWLLAIPLVICAALVWLAVTGNRYLRRTMQLAIVLGAIIHVLLFVVAVETNVFQRAWMQVVAAMDRYEKKDLVTVPDYASWQHDRERRASRDLEQPVATSLPEPTPDDVERQLLAQPPTAEEQPPRPRPEPEETVRPDVVKRQERNESNPRQRDETSRLSRKIGPVPPLPTQSIRLPDVARQEERRDESPEAPALGMAPARLESPPARQDHDQEPRTAEPSPRTDVARRLPDVSPRPESPSVAALDRQIAKPLVVPRTDVETPGPPSVVRQTDAQELLPNQTVTQGQQTRASRIQPRVEPPAQEIASQISARPRRPEQPDPRQPTVARVPPSLPTPRTPAAPRPDVPTTAEPVAAAGSNPRSETPLTPTANSEAQRAVVAVPLTEAGMQPRTVPERTDQDPAARSERRQQSAAPALPETRLTQTAPSGRRAVRTPPAPTSSDHAAAAGAPIPATDAPAATATAETSNPAAVARQAAASPQRERPRPANDSPSDVAASQSRPRPAPRTEVSGGPVAASSALPNGSPQRAHRPAPVPVSPVLAQHPAQTSVGDSPAAVQPEPATTALSKADVGIAGRGESPNLGRGDPSVEGAATVASGSAPRAQATQAAPPGPALTPHEAALVRSGRAGQTAPSSVLRATPLSLSAAHGTHRPTE